MQAKVINRYRFNTGIVVLTFYANEEKILGIEVDHSDHLNIPGVFLTKSNKIIDEAIDQVREYISGDRKEFDLPLDDQEGEFENKVYEALKDVKFGETISYKELAEKVGSDESARAVGNALAKNKFPLIIPCHRVVKADGKLGNYVGGEEAKKALLDFEQK